MLQSNQSELQSANVLSYHAANLKGQGDVYKRQR